MIILGLDPGTATGWAVVKDGKVVKSGVQRFDLSRGESPGMRFLRFRRWLSDLHSHTVIYPDKPTVFAYERAHHRGGAATEIGVNLCGRIQEYAAEQDCESLPVHTATLKKWATGKGTADKEVMRRMAIDRLVSQGCQDTRKAEMTDDEADAILVALWAAEQV